MHPVNFRIGLIVTSKRDQTCDMTGTPHPNNRRKPCANADNGCDRARWKGGYCWTCARQASLVNFPTCALEGCTRQAQSAGEGSLCRPCRTEMRCSTEGCEGTPRSDGQCRRCARGAEFGNCVVTGCPNRGFKGSRQRYCYKHSRDPGKCVRPNCPRPGVEDGVCAAHLTSCPRYCQLEGCSSPRFKARLCYKHYRDTVTVTCAYPLCADKTTGLYCADHDMGVDFAAGDWFDWVVVERILEGRLGDRQPTVPELREVLRQAEKRGVSQAELGRRLGIGEERFYQWMRAVYRLDAAEVAA